MRGGAGGWEGDLGCPGRWRPPPSGPELPCCLPAVGSVGLFRMGLWVTAPIALLKSLISVIHLITAARNMAALDAADRAKKK